MNRVTPLKMGLVGISVAALTACGSETSPANNTLQQYADEPAVQLLNKPQLDQEAAVANTAKGLDHDVQCVSATARLGEGVVQFAVHLEPSTAQGVWTKVTIGGAKSTKGFVPETHGTIDTDSGKVVGRFNSTVFIPVKIGSKATYNQVECPSVGIEQ